VGYWKRSEQIAAGKLSFEDLSLGANALLVIPGSRFQVFGGVGIGAHFLDRTAGIAQIIRDAQSTDTAFHVMAGLDVNLSGPLALFGVARKDAFGDDTDARDQTKFYGGLRLKF
jgi:opacity protein-like surface antigen